MATDTEVILLALQKERDELHEKIMQVDRIIKRVKSLEYAPEQPAPAKELKADNSANNQPVKLFTNRADIRVQVLRVFDIVRQAVRLQVIQAEYTQISGNKVSIRDTVRSLQKSTLLKLMRNKHNSRGNLWVKSEWVVNGQLLDEYKPEGFDLLNRPEDLIFE